MTTYYLACDLGLERGRILLGTLNRAQLTLQEIATFPVRAEGAAGPDLAELEKQIFAAIAQAAALDLPISGLSATSWDGDYVLLDAKDRPLPIKANGKKSASTTDRLLKKLPMAAIYAETGIPLMPLHTLFQIDAEQAANPAAFNGAERFLPIADYLNTRFSGVAACEESLASTTQLYNPQTHAWSPKLFAALNLPGSLAPRLVPSGTAIGPVVDELRRHPALLNARVVATCSHARAAAIAAIPARAEQTWAFLYSGLRSHFGAELSEPILSSQACDDGFTNEVGLGGSIHFLRNSPGLGLLEGCKRAWADVGQNYTDEQLTRMATGASSSHINPDDPRFRDPRNMLDEIANACRETGQPVPLKPGEFTRVILESLALAHGETLLRLEALTRREMEVLHVIGGRGGQNELLNQLIADATSLPVVVGPEDAAAIGNVLIQALALWQLRSPDHLRSIVATSFPTRILRPGHTFDRRTREKFRALCDLRPAAVAA
ncbi:MAG TPA: FGGY-family carbohydrate kinase [Candidatus Methylacidiphilales bacterium]|nr:FGGY-family carbohydrate kinase [Candidatus Methylacidiphilales bacterium]